MLSIKGSGERQGPRRRRRAGIEGGPSVSTSTTALGLVLAACLVGLPGPTARADQAAESRFHDEMARRYYQQGRFRDAIREFYLVQRIAPSPRILFNIGLCHRQLGDEEEAFVAYSEYLASLAPEDPDQGRRAQAEQALERLSPRVARVAVRSEPAGATIYVDRVELGSFGDTPRLIAVAEGERTIRLERPGYLPREVVVEAEAGGQVEVDARMERIVGRVEVRAVPPGEVTLRDTQGAVVESGEAPLDARLPPGTYAIEVARAGYRPHRDLLRVRRDETTRHAAVLQPLPTATGQLTITSNVTGATVFLDEEPIGFTPLIVPAVEVGSYRLRVEADDQQPFAGEVEVAAETPSWATVTLEGSDLQRHSPATWVLGAGGLVALGALAITGPMALAQHREHQRDPSPSSRERGTRLNATSDVLWVTGAVALTAALVLWILEENQEARRSRGTVTVGTGVAE